MRGGTEKFCRGAVQDLVEAQSLGRRGADALSAAALPAGTQADVWRHAATRQRSRLGHAACGLPKKRGRAGVLSTWTAGTQAMVGLELTVATTSAEPHAPKGMKSVS